MVVLSSFQCHNLEFFWKRFCDYRNYHSVTGKHRSWNLKLIGPCNPVQHGKFHHVVPRSFLRYLYNSSNAQLHNNEASIEPIPSVAAFRSATVIQPADFLQPTSLVPINDFPVFQQTKKEGQDKEIKIALSTINKHLSHIGVRTTAINLLHVKCSAYYILCISSVGLFQSLFKWRLSLWVALSTLPGYIMAVAANPVPSVFASLAIGTFLCSGSANTFNQLIERDRDALMGRTKARTLPSGKVTPDTAMKIGIIGSMAGVGILWLGTNPVTAYLGAFNIGLYALGYTPLKTVTPYNVHVGAIVGSIPTIMGCTAVGSSLLTADPWMLFIIQALWQFPHFYGVAWRYREDYLRAGFTSFPLSDTTGHQTAQMMQPYLLATAALPFITTAFGITNAMFVVDGGFFNYILWMSFKNFQEHPSNETAKKFFFVSLWHLLITLTLAVFHSRALCAKPAQATSETTETSTCLDLHHHIDSLRELMEDFCLHKKFNGLSCTKEFCVFDRIAKLKVGRFSERSNLGTPHD